MRCTAIGWARRDRSNGSDLATENLTLAAKATAVIGGTVLVEPVSGPSRIRSEPLAT